MNELIFYISLSFFSVITTGVLVYIGTSLGWKMAIKKHFREKEKESKFGKN